MKTTDNDFNAIFSDEEESILEFENMQDLIHCPLFGQAKFLFEKKAAIQIIIKIPPGYKIVDSFLLRPLPYILYQLMPIEWSKSDSPTKRKRIEQIEKELLRVKLQLDNPEFMEKASAQTVKKFEENYKALMVEKEDIGKADESIMDENIHRVWKQFQDKGFWKFEDNWPDRIRLYFIGK